MELVKCSASVGRLVERSGEQLGEVILSAGDGSVGTVFCRSCWDWLNLLGDIMYCQSWKLVKHSAGAGVGDKYTAKLSVEEGGTGQAFCRNGQH